MLLIGDEGAILVSIKGNQVLSRQFVPDSSASNLDELRQTLAGSPKAPLMLVIDTMDQSYVQQTLPPVSSMSVGKLIKRRLDRDFGVNDIKAAIVLGREKSGRKDWNFLMIALEKSPQLTAWLDFILSLQNRFMGIYLLSVETEILLRYLHPPEPKADDAKESEWKFFVSHNKVGGFRQVILRGGRIVFTRLAQPIGESNAEVIAGSIEQEMLSTIEYMKRLSYNPAAGLDIYIVAGAAIRETIDTDKFMASNVYLLTPFEVAQQLGIEGATQPTDQFGDVILASMIGCSTKHVLKFSIPQSQKADGLYQMLMLQRALAFTGVLAMLGYAFYNIYDLYTHSVLMGELELRRNQEIKRLDDLRQEIRSTNVDVERVGDLIDLYRGLREEMISPLPFIVKIHPIVITPVRIQSIDWALQEATVRKKGRQRILPTATSQQALSTAAAAGGTKKVLPQMKADLTLDFETPVSDSRGVQVLQNRLNAEFIKEFDPRFYKVSFDNKAQQGNKPASESLEVNLGEKLENKPTQASVVSQLKMTIEGDVISGNTVEPEGGQPPAPAAAPPAPDASPPLQPVSR